METLDKHNGTVYIFRIYNHLSSLNGLVVIETKVSLLFYMYLRSKCNCTNYYQVSEQKLKVYDVFFRVLL